MPGPFFSIIIPTYDRKHFVRIAVNSVLNQTFPDYELLIIDDGSNDGTKEFIREITRRCSSAPEKIRYFYQRHHGVSCARNAGIKEARGEFILFLDSDDRFCRRKLERTKIHIEQHPGVKVFHTEEIWYRNGKLLTPKAYHKKPSGFVFPHALKLCSISISTAAVKREIFAAAGGFDPALPACEDYDFWLRVTWRYPVLLIPEWLTIKEGGRSDQQSQKYPAMDKFRIYALEKLLKTNQLPNHLYQLAYEELKRKCRIYTKGALKRHKISEVTRCQNLIALLEQPAPPHSQVNGRNRCGKI